MHGDSILGLVANKCQRAFQAFVDVDLVFVGTLGPADARGRGRSRPGRRVSARREVRRRPGGGLSAKSLSPVHHERGGVAEELAKHLLGLRGQPGLGERPFHQRYPAISGALIDGEGEVSLPQSGVTPLLDVVLRAAETKDQEIPQPLLGSGQIIGGIDRTKDIVLGNLAVKSADKTGETVVADHLVKGSRHEKSEQSQHII